MFHRIVVSAEIAALSILLLSASTAFASVKCQCNNGAINYAMDADYDDDDVAQSCNDACSAMGGGTVWSADSNDADGDTTVIQNGPVRPRPIARPR